MNKLIGKKGLYPSRSELIRAAVHDFLNRELRAAENLAEFKNATAEDFDDPDKFVRVPYEKKDEDGEPVREFKCYKIVKRLEY